MRACVFVSRVRVCACVHVCVRLSASVSMYQITRANLNSRTDSECACTRFTLFMLDCQYLGFSVVSCACAGLHVSRICMPVSVEWCV